MGAGVAQNCAQSGLQVVLIDVSDEALANAEQELRRNLRFLRLVQGATAPSANDVMARIKLTTDYNVLHDADIVIENVTEDWAIKQSVYAQIDTICPDHCLFIANTSCISITQIASVTKRAPSVVGVHFMNPVPQKPTVEMIRGYHTSDETMARVQALLTVMGKEAIVVNDSPGFVSNRILMLTINEAIFTLQDQVAGVDEIDRIFKQCFGHKMGPLETADLIGLDTILASIEVLYTSFNDSKYRPCPLLKKMVAAGLYGRKSGQGFYTY